MRAVALLLGLAACGDVVMAFVPPSLQVQPSSSSLFLPAVLPALSSSQPGAISRIATQRVYGQSHFPTALTAVKKGDGKALAPKKKGGPNLIFSTSISHRRLCCL